MPNIRKSFHFREGVQVDDEVLVVRGSRVGIGTTVPDEALDVRGDAKVTGIATVNNIFSSGISTLTELRIGTGITVSSSSGIVSATKFVGDGSLLTSLPTSAWTSYGSTGIYNQSNVGVGTAFPTRDLQIGADPYAQSTLSGIGIGSDGNIKASGIVTASSFVGDITGDLTGEVNAGSLDTNANGVVVTGDLSVSGVSTLGVSTFTGAVSIGSSASFGDGKFIYMGDGAPLEIGHYDGGGHSQIKHNSATADLVLSADRLRIINRAENKDLANFIEGSHVRLYYDGTERLATSGVGVTITSQLDVGNVVASSGYAGVSGITTVGISTTGITTARGRLFTADDIKSGNGLEVTGVSTLSDDVQFFGAAGITSARWDKSQNSLEFVDDAYAVWGTGRDLQIYHNKSLASQNDANGDDITDNTRCSVIHETGSGGLVFKSDGGGGPGAFQFFDQSWKPLVKMHSGNNARVLLYHNGRERLLTTENGIKITGITTSTGRVDVGVGGTAFTALPTGRVGVGTAIPGVDLQIKKATGSAIEVISDSGDAKISIGNNSVGAGNSAASLRFNNANDGTLDIVNYDIGGINMYLQAGSAGVTTGRFGWIDGQTNLERLSLTHEGKLGVGRTNPTNTFEVVGTSTVTGNAYIGGTLGVAQTITSPTFSGNLVGNVTGNVTGNANGLQNTPNITVGIVTAGISTFVQIGINTSEIHGNSLIVGGSQGVTGKIGIGTTAPESSTGYFGTPGNLQVHGSGIGLYGGSLNIKATVDAGIGIGTTEARAVLDVYDCYSGGSAQPGVGTASFILPPKVTTSERAGLGTDALPGAIIWNHTDSKLQVYTGTAWVNLH